jgi:site-specific recombinase XerD
MSQPQYTPNPTARALVPAEFEGLIDLAVNGMDSERSKRAYRAAIRDFLTWWAADGRPALSKATVNRYKDHLQHTPSARTGQPLSASTINLTLAAIRKLVSEAADNDLVDPMFANGVKAVKGVKREGVRAGNWLSLEQARRLVNAPDTTTLRGLRDRAILAVLVLAGLRRDECAALTVEHLQQREGRWAIIDLVGKRGKVRSVPVAESVKTALDAWCHAAGITSGAIWRSFRKGDRLEENSRGMSAQAIWCVVTSTAAALGFEAIAPHDLRRTYAKLAYKGGATVEQISLNLGHESLKTTQRYLGIDLDWEAAPTDYIDIGLDED